MKLGPKQTAPIAVLVAAVGIVVLLVVTRTPIQPKPPDVVAPLVRTVVAQPGPFQFVVQAQGTVVPRRESDLVPQVSGEVVWVSPDLVDGGFFEAGQPLVRIDRADYEAALESARANVARSESEYARAKKERGRQRSLADRSVASQANIDDAENAYRVAEATLRERRAQLETAQRDLERTELRAPYDGRVRQEQVDDGQFASRGVPLAKLYAVDYAEVVLPLPDRELAYLDLSLARRTQEDDPAPSAGEDAEKAPPEARRDSGPVVTLRADFAGRRNAWQGRIVRTEGEIDPKSRMVQVVARVEDPYGVAATADRPPLAVGLFVEAEIEGRVVQDAFVLPRSALHRDREEDDDQVLVVDADSRLRFRPVDVLRTEHERVIVGAGLEAGDRICISPLRAVTDGMRVRVAQDTAVAPELAGAGS